MTIDPDAVLLQDRYEPEGLAEAIIDRHYAALHFLSYSILGDADEADDAVQESIIRAVARIDSYKPATNMKSWLSAIVVNQCRDMLRRRKARRRLRSGLVLLFRNRASESPLEDQVVNKEAKSELWMLVNRLGEKHRLPIILRYVHKLSVREISEILDLREGTVNSRLYYGCRKLGQQLAVTDEDDLIAELLNG